MVGFWSAITQFHSTSPFSFWMAVTDSRCQCTEANFFHQQHLAIWQAALEFLLAASEQLNGSTLHILPGKLIYLGGILTNVLPYPYILCNGFLPMNMPVNYLHIKFPQRRIFICIRSPVLKCSFTICRLLWSQLHGTRIPELLCWGTVEAMQLISSIHQPTWERQKRNGFSPWSQLQIAFVCKIFPFSVLLPWTKTFYIIKNS